MKSKNFSKRTIMFTILPILLILTMILNMAYFSLKNSISVDASANNNENYEAATCTMEAEGNIYVKPKLENDFVKANSNFTISFETNLENYKVSSYETEGINIISQSVNKNIITFTVFYSYNSKFQVRIYDENNKEIYASSYTTGKSLTITEGQLYHFLANGTCYARVFGYDSTSPESCFFSNAIVPYLNRGDIVGSKLVRSSEYRINDEGFMVNSYDRIDIQSITGFTYTQLKNLGYKNLKIEISINVREINDGYQHIAIFDSSFENAKELASTKFEHGRLKKDTSTKTYNFTYNISLDDIPSSLFYIRYDGSGAFEDDWVNSNLNVKLTVSQ